MTDYNETVLATQFQNVLACEGMLSLPSDAPGFVQSGCECSTIEINEGSGKKPRMRKKTVHTCTGRLSDALCAQFEQECCVCHDCLCKTYKHTSFTITLRHKTFGTDYIDLKITCLQRRCPKCGKFFRQQVPFRHPDHLITNAAAVDVIRKMISGSTAKQAASASGIHRSIIKELDKEYLKSVLLGPDGKPKIEGPCEHPGVDEQLLHEGHQFATVIIDMKTGAVLQLEETKTKQVIYDFMEHAGEEFMKNVKTISCDMNADFASAFTSRYPHLEVVYDRFHLIKNFNEKVITPVRIQTQHKLELEGRHKEAVRLKKCKYILTANKDVLEQKDAQAAALIEQGAMAGGPGTQLFISPKKFYKPRADHVERLDALLEENKQFSVIQIIKEQLKAAYGNLKENEMFELLANIMDLCRSQSLEPWGKHFLWFAGLIARHLDGILAYARYRITSGKCEGVVNRIKTIRRQAYGFRDTDYFFLKIMAATRAKAPDGV